MIDVAIPVWEVVVRLGAAVVVGGILGWERERAKKPAGFRTMMLVALGSAVFTLVNMILYQEALAQNPDARVDYLRIIEGVTGGIGFLGAGTIFRSGGSVDGITTAATIWVVGGLGVCCGTGAYSLAAVTVLFALAVLTAMRTLEARWSPGTND